MKLLLFILPLALAGPLPDAEKRDLVSSLSKFLHVDQLQNVVTQIFNTLGTDETEAKCESKCHTVMNEDQTPLLQFTCTPICKSFQSLVNHFHLSAPVDPQAVGKREVQKRLFLEDLKHILHLDQLKQLVSEIVHQAGSDPTEKQCETSCHNFIITGHLLQSSCPLVCRSFQQLVQHYDITTTAATTVATQKRGITDFISSIFNVNELTTLLQQILDSAGSNETEKTCERSCGNYIQQDHILQFGCPLVCHSFQELVHHFKLTPKPAGTAAAGTKRKLLDPFQVPVLSAASFQDLSWHHKTNPSPEPKRGLLDSFLKTDELKLLVTQLFNTLGSDSTEAKCETECNTLVHQDHILHYACPLTCRSMQSLVQHFGLSAPVDPAAVGKRALFGFDALNKVLHVDELKNLVNQLHTQLGSDVSEQLCEQECNILIQEEHILHYGCPLVCHSFQELLHHFNSAVGNSNAPAATNKMQRRFLVADLLSSPEIKPLVEQLYQTLGSDESEQNCEKHCVPLALNLPDHGSISQYACPFVCNSFQSLLHKFDIHTLTGPSAGTGSGASTPASS